MPALVSTLCICIVFLPMFFLNGVARFLFVPLAEAVGHPEQERNRGAGNVYRGLAGPAQCDGGDAGLFGSFLQQPAGCGIGRPWQAALACRRHLLRRPAMEQLAEMARCLAAP